MARKGIDWKAELERLDQLSQEGRSLTDIASYYMVTPACISQVFKRYGLKPAFTRGRPRGRYEAKNA